MKNILKSVLAFAALSVSAFAQVYQPVHHVSVTNLGSQFYSNAITSTASAPTNPANLCFNSVQFDATGFTQMRVVAVLGGTTSSNNTTTLVFRYQPNSSSVFKDNTFSHYLQSGAGTTDVGVVLGTQTGSMITGPWTALDPGAIGDNVWTMGAVDTSNAGLRPLIGGVAIEFR